MDVYFLVVLFINDYLSKEKRVKREVIWEKFAFYLQTRA